MGDQTNTTANPATMRLWIAALRSGKYQQGIGHLATIDNENPQLHRYCCLGVACEVAIDNGVEVPRAVAVTVDGALIHYSGHGVSLPDAVREWLGLPEYGPVVITDGGHLMDVVTANDSAGWDFHRIADALEHTYLNGEQ